MTEQEEKFLHLAYCIDNLNNSWRILNELKENKASPVLANAAFQFALIEYSKPYKISYGNVLKENGKQKSYKLGTEYIPENFIKLHERILAARDKLHAHSDLSLLEAKVYVRENVYGKSVNYIKNVIYGTEEWKNIDSIIVLIERTLDILYHKEKELKQALPIN